MDHAFGMHVPERGSDLLSHRSRPSLWQRPAPLLRHADGVRQVPALGVVHDDVQLVLRLEGLEDADDVWVVQGSQRIHLCLNLLFMQAQSRLVHRLDHPHCIQRGVGGQVDLTEGPGPELFAHAVGFSHVFVGVLLDQVPASDLCASALRLLHLEPSHERLHPVVLRDGSLLVVGLPSGPLHQQPEHGEGPLGEVPPILDQREQPLQALEVTLEAPEELPGDRLRLLLGGQEHVQAMLVIASPPKLQGLVAVRLLGQ
mmetsp:Transcript_52121/g.136947  ORF Transcript_52121/g.136947 Transcript_52121/m.136947 type:complete len:257 (+) Transcript_52121:333-1103(+)